LPPPSFPPWERQKFEGQSSFTSSFIHLLPSSADPGDSISKSIMPIEYQINAAERMVVAKGYGAVCAEDLFVINAKSG
jgi:hypothetical protein